MKADLTVDRNWRKQDGIIYFSVTSDGTTGEEWIKRLELKGLRVDSEAKSLLLSEDFRPTFGVVTEVAVITTRLFNARALAVEYNLKAPNAEIACLIREKFTDEDLRKMGFFSVFVVHEHIKDSHGDPRLLYVTCDGVGHYLGSYCGILGAGGFREYGFAFAVS